MFDKFSRSWELVKASASVIRSDKELLLFPIFSGLAAIVVLATFAVPVFTLKLFEGDSRVLGYILGFLLYLCLYFVTFFFNAALVGAALIRLEGGDPTVADGFAIARAKIVPILGYAAIAATVGMILQALKDKENNILVRMVASGLGVAWTLATFLVVPVLVVENVGPIDALKQSVALLKRTWGENAIGNVGIGFVFGVMMTLAILLSVAVVFGAAMLSPKLALVLAAVCVLGVIMLGIVQSALSGIYSAALYRYATDGHAPAGFEGTAIATAFAPKR
jgi:hypothetical protein